MNTAKPTDWKTKPMPPNHNIVTLNRELTDDDYKCLLIGIIPKEMEDRWFMYTVDNQIHIHRSWTGYCIFVLRSEIINGKHTLTEALVNQDPDQYKAGSKESVIANINLILGWFIERNRILLNE